MFVRDCLTVKILVWTGPVCMFSYSLSVDIEILCDDKEPNVRMELRRAEERMDNSK